MYLADYISILSALINLTIFIKDKISSYSYIKITNYRITKKRKSFSDIKSVIKHIVVNRKKNPLSQIIKWKSNKLIDTVFHNRFDNLLK